MRKRENWVKMGKRMRPMVLENIWKNLYKNRTGAKVVKRTN